MYSEYTINDSSLIGKQTFKISAAYFLEPYLYVAEVGGGISRFSYTTPITPHEYFPTIDQTINSLTMKRIGQ